MIGIAALQIFILAGAIVLLHWGTRWGSTAAERARKMPCDECLENGSPARVVMTRAISIDAPPVRVWPWIAQLGRGAGWYSVDWLDNGRRTSARHVVSWVPEPRLGDATAIGHVRHVQAGRSIAWWVGRVGFLGAPARLVTSYVLESEGAGTRLVSRMSADAEGMTAGIALLVFRVVDSVMAIRQLLCIRDRIEYCEAHSGPIDPETGARDQYQLYEVLYAGGESAGVAGKEQGALWRQSAIEEGLLQSREWIRR